MKENRRYSLLFFFISYLPKYWINVNVMKNWYINQLKKERMKKLIFFLIASLCLLSVIHTEAQGVKKITTGLIFAASGTTDFTTLKKPFVFGQNLLLNACFITSKTYHNCVYSLPFNTLKVVNGIPFGGNGMDVYFVPGYNFYSKVGSFATGIERKINTGSDITFFLFAEGCQEIKSGSKTTFSLGFHVNIQSTLFCK